MYQRKYFCTFCGKGLRCFFHWKIMQTLHAAWVYLLLFLMNTRQYRLFLIFYIWEAILNIWYTFTSYSQYFIFFKYFTVLWPLRHGSATQSAKWSIGDGRCFTSVTNKKAIYMPTTATFIRSRDLCMVSCVRLTSKCILVSLIGNWTPVSSTLRDIAAS